MVKKIIKLFLEQKKMRIQFFFIIILINLLNFNTVTTFEKNFVKIYFILLFLIYSSFNSCMQYIFMIDQNQISTKLFIYFFT